MNKPTWNDILVFVTMAIAIGIFEIMLFVWVG